MTDSITTHQELLAAIRSSADHDLVRHTPDGVATYRNDDRFFAIGEELEDDGETLWGWTWSTGVYGTDGVAREVMEYFDTDASQDAAEPLAAAIRHLGAI